MNPILISFGNVEIRWYSALILLAFFIVSTLIIKETNKFNIDKNLIFNLIFYCLIIGIIGARLYYVLFNLDIYMSDPIEILRVWNGGLAIHGGLIAGVLTLFFYCNKHKIRPIRMLDFVCVPLLLGQAIGRWGNFFNQEAHGAATTIAHLKSLNIPSFIIKGMTIDGVTYTPTFLYESIVCLIAFIILLFIRRSKKNKVGYMTSLYLIIYGTLRFFIETTRTDALMIGGFKIAQIVSIIMIAIGIAIIISQMRKSRFEDLYSDQENISNIN